MPTRLATSISSASFSGSSSGSSVQFYETTVSSQPSVSDSEAPSPLVDKGDTFSSRPSLSYPKGITAPFFVFYPERPCTVTIRPRAAPLSDPIDSHTASKSRIQVLDSEDVDRWVSGNASTKVLQDVRKPEVYGPLSFMVDIKTPSMAFFMSDNTLFEIEIAVQKLADESGLTVTVHPKSAFPSTGPTSAVSPASVPLEQDQEGTTTPPPRPHGDICTQSHIENEMGTSPPAQTPTESDQTLMQPQPLQVCVTSPGNPEDPPANVMTTCPTVHAININLRLKGEPFKNSLLSLFWQYTFYPNPNPTPDDLILGISPIASEAGVRMSVVGIVSDGFEVSKVHSQLEFNKADIEDQFYSSSPADYGFDRGSVRQKNTSNSSSQWTTNAPVGFPRAGPMANFGYSSMKGKGSGSEVGGDEKHRDWVVDVAGSNFPSPSSHSHRFIVSRTTPSSLAKSDNIRPMLSATFGMRLEEHVPPPSCKDPIVFKQTHQVFVWTSSKPPRGIIIIVEHELLDMTTTTAAVVRANLAISCPPLLPSATLPAEKITGETSVVSWTKAGETHENFGAALELVPVQEFTLRSRNPILEVPVRPVAANGWDVSSNDWLSAPWPEIIYDEDNPGEVLMDTEPL